MLARVKKNDTVQVISGKDKGKQGVVMDALPKKDQVLVKGVGIITRHVKPKRAGETGGIKKEEGYIKASIVMPVCTACKKPSRVEVKILENNKRVRACHRCHEAF